MPENALRALRRALPLPRRALSAEAPADGGEWRLDAGRSPTYVVEYTRGPARLAGSGVGSDVRAGPTISSCPRFIAKYARRWRSAAPPAATPASWPCSGTRPRALSARPRATSHVTAPIPITRNTRAGQYVMKTHMRVPQFNDRRSFRDAAAAGMRHTRAYAACWDRGLGLDAGERADQAVGRRARVAELAVACAPRKFHANLFQAYVLKSAYYYQLLPWMAAAPDRVLVLTLEAFDAAALERVADFLGLGFLGADAYRSHAEIERLVGARRNQARDGGAQRLDAAQRAELDDFFRPMDRKLDALLGRATGYPV